MLANRDVHFVGSALMTVSWRSPNYSPHGRNLPKTSQAFFYLQFNDGNMHTTSHPHTRDSASDITLSHILIPLTFLLCFTRALHLLAKRYLNYSVSTNPAHITYRTISLLISPRQISRSPPIMPVCLRPSFRTKGPSASIGSRSSGVQTQSNTC